MPPPSELSDDLLGEVFLRLPPDDPACLLRASLACKRWRRVLADSTFHRRHRELHRTPSVVGFLRRSGSYASRFVTSNPASGRPAARDLPGWILLDCRHGRGLFLAPSPSLGTVLNYDIIVWDPLTNEQRRLPRPSPPPTYLSFNAAVLCSADAQSCDHRNCHGGPFRVAFVWCHGRADPFPSIFVNARVYSSETDNWSEAISVLRPNRILLPMLACARISFLVGDTLYFHYDSNSVLQYQLGAQRLSIIGGPPRPVSHIISAVFFMSVGDSGLGCMDVEEDESSLRLQLWSREAASDSDEVARWTRGRAIDLEKLLPDGALPSPRWASDPRSRIASVQLLGFAEGTDVTFVGTWSRNRPGSVYMVQLNSGRARMVFDRCTLVYPYTSFCIPVTDASSTTEGPADNASGASQSQAACAGASESTRKHFVMFPSCVSEFMQWDELLEHVISFCCETTIWDLLISWWRNYLN